MTPPAKFARPRSWISVKAEDDIQALVDAYADEDQLVLSIIGGRREELILTGLDVKLFLDDDAFIQRVHIGTPPSSPVVLYEGLLRHSPSPPPSPVVATTSDDGSTAVVLVGGSVDSICVHEGRLSAYESDITHFTLNDEAQTDMYKCNIYDSIAVQTTSDFCMEDCVFKNPMRHDDCVTIFARNRLCLQNNLFHGGVRALTCDKRAIVVNNSINGHNVTQHGMALADLSGLVSTEGYRMDVRDNRIADCYNGIFISQGEAVLENNEMYRITKTGIMIGAHASVEVGDHPNNPYGVVQLDDEEDDELSD